MPFFHLMLGEPDKSLFLLIEYIEILLGNNESVFIHSLIHSYHLNLSHSPLPSASSFSQAQD